MKKILFGVAALGLLGLAGAGLGLKAQDTVEAKAETAYRAQAGFKTGDTIYVQPKTNWTAASAKLAIAFISEGDTHTTWSPFLETLSRDGIYKWTIDDSFDYVAVKIIVARFDPSAPTPDWGNYKSWGQTKDLVVNDSGFVATNNTIWLDDNCGDSSNAGFFAYDESDYQLTIGDETHYLSRDSVDDGELKGTFTVAASETVSLSIDGAPADINPNALYSNNLTIEKKIKVAGTVTFFVSTAAGHTTWVSGYSGSGATGLQTFCDYLLSATVSAGVCADPTGELWNNIKGSWDYCDGTAKAEFNSAAITLGAEVAHASVVAEARSRYAYLNGKYGVSLDGATLPSAFNVAALESSNDNSFGIAAISLIAITLLGAGAFFIARKRRAE